MALERVATLLDAVTAVGAGPWHELGANSTFDTLSIMSASTGSATILIEVANQMTSTMAKTLATFNLNISAAAGSEGTTKNAAWKYTRANVTAISSANATVSVFAGHEEAAKA